MNLLSAEPFVPHTLEHLTEVRVFPTPLPKVAYNKLLADYEALKDVHVSRIVYNSDGLKVTGIMALPASLQDKGHPLLVYNRGGSREYGKLTVLSVMRSMVPYARAGYIVYASNYRGNDGGEGHDEFGGADVDDVLNLMDIAKENPAWDGKNAFMLGHSRGGMMTAMALRRGATVNAAVSIAGLLDAHVLADEPNMVERILVPVVPGYLENPHAVLSARSALDWPGEIPVPLLLLHGDNDKDVNVQSSIRLHAALEALGKATDLKVYPGGNHSLFSVWDDVVPRCLAWMGRFSL